MSERVTLPGESLAYRQARDRLLLREIALRREMEAVAAERRALPPGPAMLDHVFDGLGADGRPARVRLSELFRDRSDTLVVYCYMFPRHRGDDRPPAAEGETARLPLAEQPCPSCTALLDQLDAAVAHFEAGGGSFAVAAHAPLWHLLGVARDRGWRHLRLLSTAGNDFKQACHAQDDDGQQAPVVAVLKKDDSGAIRLFWVSEMVFAESDPGQEHRAAGTLEPFWNLFDLGPHGRPDFQEQLQYGCCSTHP